MVKIDSFEEFLNQKQRVADGNKVDWEARKTKWIQSVDALFTDVRCWLAPFEAKGLVHFKEREVDCWEDYIGDYKTKKLEVFLGNDIVTLIPKGTFILGSLGRVDMLGSRGEAMLLEHEWSQWKFARRNPTLITWDVTAETFKNELQRLA